MKRNQIFVLLILAVSLVFWSCGGGDKQAAENTGAETSAIVKDMATPAEAGGYGFEKLADE